MMPLLSDLDFVIGEAQKYNPPEVDSIYDSDLIFTLNQFLNTVTS